MGRLTRWIVKTLFSVLIGAIMFGLTLGNGDAMFLFREAKNLWGQRDVFIAKYAELKKQQSQLDEVRRQMQQMQGVGAAVGKAGSPQAPASGAGPSVSADPVGPSDGIPDSLKKLIPKVPSRPPVSSPSQVVVK